MVRVFNSSLGIDFRKNHLILTLLRKGFGRIRLLDYRIYPLGPEGQKELREAQWLSLITTFVSNHQIDRDRVSIGIPREKVIVRFLRLPLATKENLRSVLAYESPKYIPFGKEEVLSDYQLLREDKEWVTLVAVFARRADLDPYLALLKKIGLRPSSIQIPSTAALNLFFYNQKESKDQAVLVNLHDPFVEMDIVLGREWRESFHLPLPAGGRKEGVLQIWRRSSRNGDPQKFFVWGLEGADGMLSGETGGDGGYEFGPPPLDRIESGRGETKPEHIYSSIGIALKGLARTAIHLDLLPPEMKKKELKLGRPILLGLTALLLALALTWGVRTTRGYQDELAAVRAEIKTKKPEVEAVARLQRERGEIQRKIEELKKITSEDVSKVAILKELTQVLPPSVWIWSLRVSGKEVEISGYADSASDLISLLDKSPLFEKVEFLAPVTKEREKGAGGERERFKIKMRLEGRRA